MAEAVPDASHGAFDAASVDAASVDAASVDAASVDAASVDVAPAAALEVALEAAEIAVELLHSTPRGTVRTKTHAADPVTDLDTTTERAVRDHLARAFPDHAVVGEEYGGAPGGALTWYCDPVDGTTNLTAGLPWTSFSLALAVGRTPLVGVVADPWRDELLYAVRGRGAHRRPVRGTAMVGRRRPVPGRDAPTAHDERLAAAAAEVLAGSVLLTEWAAHLPWPGMRRLLEDLAEAMCTTRIMGSGTLAVASVGAGRAAGAVIGEFHPEDHLAAVLICREAGALVTGVDGRETGWPGAGPFLAAAPGVAPALRDLLDGMLSGEDSAAP